MNVATPVLDLSNVYGGNLMNDSLLLRTFIGGYVQFFIFNPLIN
jgi:hypothetical protein